MADDLGYNPELDGDAEQAPVSVADNLLNIADYEGNLLDLMEEEQIRKLGHEVIAEYDIDVSSRSEWLAGVQRAVKASKQKPEAKDWPFTKASNIKYPILTSASIQFASRAYGALTRGDQPTVCKVVGSDPDGMKQKKADRLTRWNNHSLMYLMDEWDPGTDRLLHVLPIVGSAFRKCYFDTSMGRTVAEFARAQDVVVNYSSPSFDRAPRQTQPCRYYPHEINQMIKSGKWVNHEYDKSSNEDSQSPVEYLEQLRYIDLDGDGLSEPYIVTVEKCYEMPVRIDPAFYPNGLMITEQGGVETILRESPWIDYKFLPDIGSSDEEDSGSVYGMGFGQLLESLGSAINTLLNQTIDAGTRANTGGGFISDTLRLKGARGGTMSINPGEYKMVKNSGGAIQDGIHTLQFPGPSPVQFSLLEFLLAAAQDITAVKDVLTGDAPSGQAMGATLALIEQAQEVFSTIYTRIYRSQRKEMRLLCRLNKTFLNPTAYLNFHDDPEFAQMVAQGHNALDDFDLTTMDLAPSADPKSVTDMQRIMRSQFLGQFLGQPGINNQEIQRRQMQAANIEDLDKLFVQQADPMQELEAEEKKADVALKQSQAAETEAKALKTEQEVHEIAHRRGVEEGLAGGVDDMGEQPNDAGVSPMAPDAGAGAPAGMGAGPEFAS